MPVFGVALAWLFLGERPAPYHAAGIALILCGIWATSRFGGKRIEADEVAAVGTD
jgi:drug/metabolite transporter (DMT)-like permease